MNLDLVESKTLNISIVLAFLFFLFLPFELVMKILFFVAGFYFLFLFSVCTIWTNEFYPEMKFLIGFLISFFHTFFLFLGGFLGWFLAQIALKLYPFLVDYFRSAFRF
jgi:hypothetical protein